MAALSENSIIDIVYSLYETDTTGWGVTDEEYLAARQYACAAVRKWEFYDNTAWRELFTNLTAAADGDKTLATDDYTYGCPTNFRKLTSWVRTTNSSSTSTFWTPIPPEKVAQYAKSDAKICWITGSEKAGHVLNFNSNVDLTSFNGDTIEYEYYKQATVYTAITDTSEVSDPYFIVYFILARFLKNDGEDNMEELQEADDRLETMRVANMSGYFNVLSAIEETLSTNAGFGI